MPVFCLTMDQIYVNKPISAHIYHLNETALESRGYRMVAMETNVHLVPLFCFSASSNAGDAGPHAG